MRAGIFKQNQENRADVHRWFRYVLLGSALLNFILAATLAIQVSKAERTVLVPPEISRSFWVDGEHLDPAYLEQMGVYVAGLFASFSPASIDFQHGILLKITDPAQVPALQVRFRGNANRIKNDNLTQVFIPNEIRVSADTNTVVVFGTQSRYVVDKMLSQGTQKAYLVRFAHRNGKVTIAALYETSPNNPYADMSDEVIERADAYDEELNRAIQLRTAGEKPVPSSENDPIAPQAAAGAAPQAPFSHGGAEETLPPAPPPLPAEVTKSAVQP